MQAIPGATSVTISALPIAIWCSDYDPPTDDEPAKLLSSPVRGAYVAVVRISGAWRGPFSEELRLRLGRTNDFGWVMSRQRGELGEEDDVPRSGWRRAELPPGGAPHANLRVDPDDAGVRRPTSLEMFVEGDPVMVETDSGDANPDVLYALPNETYRIHWSYDRALFDLFLEKYEADPEQAFAEFQVREYVVQPFPQTAEHGFFDELTPAERGWVARQLSSGREGYHAGWPRTKAMSCAIFDGTPRVFRTLFLCEWLSDTRIRLIQKDQDWAHLNAVCGVIEAALDGAVIPDLAKDFPVDARAQEAYQVRAYLHALASAGLDNRPVVEELVDVAGLNRTSHWHVTAKSLQENSRFAHIAHPALRHETHGSYGLRGYYFSADEQAALVAHFDMYALGFSFSKEKGRIESSWADVLAVAERVASNASNRLGSISIMAVMRAIAMHLPKGSARPRAAEHYYRTCAQLGVRFWDHPDLSATTKAQWDAYKPFIAWLGEGVGLLTEMLVGTLEPHLLLHRALTAGEVTKVIDFLYRHELVLKGKPLDLALPTSGVRVRLVPSGSGKELIATATSNDGTTELARMRVLTHVEPDSRSHVWSGIDARSRAKVRRFRAAQGRDVRRFVIERETVLVPDAARLEGFSKGLALFASSIKLTLATKALIDEVRTNGTNDNFDTNVYLNVAQEALAAVVPTTEVIAMALDRTRYRGASDVLVRGAKRLSALGLLSESIRNIAGGLTTLATLLPYAARESVGQGDTTDLDRYLDQGDAVAALVETTKGALQIGIGAAQLLAVGGATTIAAMPLAQVVSVGLFSVALMDVIIYLHTGGSSPVQGFKDGVRLGQRRQFSDGAGSDAQRGPSAPSCRLARRLGALEALAKV